MGKWEDEKMGKWEDEKMRAESRNQRIGGVRQKKWLNRDFLIVVRDGNNLREWVSQQGWIAQNPLKQSPVRQLAGVIYV